MPIITEQELQGFNEKSTELKRLSTDHEYLQESFDKTIKQRNIFLALAILFLVALGITFLLKSLKPELFINGYKLESRGLTLIETKDYQALKDLETASLAYENTETDPEPEPEYSDEEESISGQTIYAVQIGAFRNNDIELYSESFTQFKEFEEAGFYKYSLGAFETLEEAQDLRKKVIGIGFSDAFVASYINGERQAIEEAY